MHRRAFLQLTGGVLAAGALTGGLARLTYADTVKRGVKGGKVNNLVADDYTRMRRFIATSFGRTAYVEQGSGPAALFLHGFPLNSYQWRGALPRLAAYRRCLAPDSMGLGYTEVKPGKSVTPASQVDMLIEFLDTLGVGSVDLVANDSGGAVAQLFMVRQADRVRSVLLTNCDVENDSPPPAVMPVIEAARKGTFARDFFVKQVDDHALVRAPDGLGGACYTFPDHPTDDAIDMYMRPLVATPERMALTNAYALGLFPNPLAGIEASLRRIQSPVRIVWGTGDTIFSPKSPDYLDGVLPLSHGVRKVKGAKLFFPEEYPELIAEEAKRLWDAV
jgi:pimeloyl-ACP methyl ester carboxylesterase